MTTSELAYLCRGLRVSNIARHAERIADMARAKGWSHEQFLCAVLEKELSGRQASGAEIRIRAARFPGRKSIEDFDFEHQRSIKRELISALCSLDFFREDEVPAVLPGCFGLSDDIGSIEMLMVCSPPRLDLAARRVIELLYLADTSYGAFHLMSIPPLRTGK